MLSFNDWVKKEKKGYETKLLDDEPVILYQSIITNQNQRNRTKYEKCL